MTQLNNAFVKSDGGKSAMGAFLHAPAVIPGVDVTETGEAYILHLDMPGAQKDAISVTVADGTLAVNGPMTPIHGDAAAVLYSEILTGAYERRFTLGEGIDRNNVDARYENGVLTVTLLKSEASKPKEIVIR